MKTTLKPTGNAILAQARVVSGNAERDGDGPFKAPANRRWQRQAGAVCALLVAVSTQAQTTYTVGHVGFSAYTINGTNNATLTLTRGATYVFNVNAPGHPFWIKTSPTTGTGSAFAAGVVNNGVEVGPVTFTVPAGSPSPLYYICQYHAGMQGRLNIIDPPLPPLVALTNPPSGITLAAPATITLGASASDLDGSVTHVQFLSGASVLGGSTNSPYTLVVSNLPAATYHLTAQAVDNSGARATSAVVTVTVVVPGPIRFDTKSVPVEDQLQLNLTVTPGLSYQIDHTSGFDNWLKYTNFVATDPVMSFATPVTGAQQRFFRAWLLPNP